MFQKIRHIPQVRFPFKEQSKCHFNSNNWEWTQSRRVQKNCSPTLQVLPPQEKKPLARLLKHRKQATVGEKKRQEVGIWGKKSVGRQSFGRRAEVEKKGLLYVGIYGHRGKGSQRLSWRWKISLPGNGSRGEICKAHCTNCQLQDSRDLLTESNSAHLPSTNSRLQSVLPECLIWEKSIIIISILIIIIARVLSCPKQRGDCSLAALHKIQFAEVSIKTSQTNIFKNVRSQLD